MTICSFEAPSACDEIGRENRTTVEILTGFMIFSSKDLVTIPSRAYGPLPSCPSGNPGIPQSRNPFFQV
jgi:hypothetical protein